MTEEFNIQGKAEGFGAGYATRILCAIIAEGKMSNEGNLKTTWTAWADHVYNWMLKKALPPMSDDQFAFIQDLMKARGFTDNMIRVVEDRAMRANHKEASEIISQLLIEELPHEYKGWHKNKGEALEAIRNLVSKDQS